MRKAKGAEKLPCARGLVATFRLICVQGLTVARPSEKARVTVRREMDREWRDEHAWHARKREARAQAPSALASDRRGNAPAETKCRLLASTHKHGYAADQKVGRAVYDQENTWLSQLRARPLRESVGRRR